MTHDLIRRMSTSRQTCTRGGSYSIDEFNDSLLTTHTTTLSMQAQELQWSLTAYGPLAKVYVTTPVKVFPLGEVPVNNVLPGVKNSIPLADAGHVAV